MNLEEKKLISNCFPIKDWDLEVNTKFVQFLDVSAIEKLYQKVNLIDLNKVSEQDYFYIKGSLDTLYALIGVRTPLLKLLEATGNNLTDEEIGKHISVVTETINASRELRMETLKFAEKDFEKENKIDSLAEFLESAIKEMGESVNE